MTRPVEYWMDVPADDPVGRWREVKAAREFWHVSYPVYDDRGMANYWQEIGESKMDARLRARSASKRHGHATVTNRQGLVATYVAGKEYLPVPAVVMAALTPDDPDLDADRAAESAEDARRDEASERAEK